MRGSGPGHPAAAQLAVAPGPIGSPTDGAQSATQQGKCSWWGRRRQRMRKREAERGRGGQASASSRCFLTDPGRHSSLEAHGPPSHLPELGMGPGGAPGGEGPQVLQEEATFLSASSPRDKNTSLQNQLLILLLGRVQAQNCHFVLSLAEQLLLGIRLSNPGSGLGGGTRRQALCS